MRAINILAAGIAAASIVMAGAPAAFAEETAVAEAPAPADTTGPALVSITGVPTTVVPGEPFEFAATAADASGVAELIFGATESLRYPRFTTPVYSAGALIDNGDGTWTKHFTYAIPRDVPYGTYELGTIGMTDGAGNYAASSWTTPRPTITVDDPAHRVGALTVLGSQLTNSTVSARLEASGAAVTYFWQGSSASGTRAYSSTQSFELPLFLGGATVTLRAKATWPDGTVRERTTTFIPGKGSMPLDPVTLGEPRVGAVAPSGYTPLGTILGRYPTAYNTQTFQWTLDGKPIPGATAATYTPTPADRGGQLQLRVTSTTNLPFAEQAVTQYSPARAVASGVLSAPTPKVAGSKYVGSKLTAAAGTWTKGTRLSYQWYRSGKAIRGATRSVYTSVPADHGKSVTVKVTGKLSGYTSRTVTSAAIKATLRKLTSPRIEPNGSWEAGSRVSARNYPNEKWTSGTRITYQWLRDGKPMKGVTTKTYVIKRSDEGHRLSVRLTGTKYGYLPAVRTTTAVRI